MRYCEIPVLWELRDAGWAYQRDAFYRDLRRDDTPGLAFVGNLNQLARYIDKPPTL